MSKSAEGLGKNALKNVTNKKDVAGDTITVKPATTTIEVVVEKKTPTKRKIETRVTKATTLAKKRKTKAVDEEVVETIEVKAVEVEQAIEVKPVEKAIEVKPVAEETISVQESIADQQLHDEAISAAPSIKKLVLKAPPSTPSKTPAKRTRKTPASRTPAKTPSRKRKAASPSPPPAPSPSVSIPALLNTLTTTDDDLDILPTLPPSTKRTRLDTFLAPTTPSPTLPEILTPFPPLFAAFLTAFTLHTSLLPTGVYPSLTTLLPTLQRLHPRTPITLPLIRTLLSLTPHFKLINMGPTRGLHLKPTSPLPPPETLKTLFLSHLHTLGPSPLLTEAPIQQHKHLPTITHILGKKTRDIRDFLSRPTKPLISMAPKTGDANSRKLGLAERIRAKEAAAKDGVMSDEQILRAAARGRVEEVKGVLRGLRSRERGGSVGLARVVEVVRESVRVAVDREVAECAVRICAEEEAWVGLLERCHCFGCWGGMESGTEGITRTKFYR